MSEEAKPAETVKPIETVETKITELAEGKAKTEEKPDDDILSKARERLKQLKETNDAIAAEHAREEEDRARQMVGGKADAGTPEKTVEEEADETAKEMLKPFGY